MHVAELDSNPHSERLFVQFSMHPVQNKAKSAEEGRPIFEEREYVEIAVPGDKANAVHRPVTAEDKHRFAAQYQAWQQNRGSGGAIGTPLSQWPVLSSAQVQELAYFKCHTVEQLAGMSDGNLRNVGPILELRKKAQAFLSAAKDAAPVAKLQAELEKRDAQIAALQAQMADVVAKFEAKAKK